MCAWCGHSILHRCNCECDCDDTTTSLTSVQLQIVTVMIPRRIKPAATCNSALCLYWNISDCFYQQVLFTSADAYLFTSVLNPMKTARAFWNLYCIYTSKIRPIADVKCVHAIKSYKISTNILLFLNVCREEVCDCLADPIDNRFILLSLTVLAKIHRGFRVSCRGRWGLGGWWLCFRWVEAWAWP